MTYLYQSQLSTATSQNSVSHGKLCKELLWKETTLYELHGLKILFSGIQPMKWFSSMNQARMGTQYSTSMSDHHGVSGLRFVNCWIEVLGTASYQQSRSMVMLQ